MHYLKTPTDVKCYLEAALEEKDDEYLKIAVKDSIKALEKWRTRFVQKVRTEVGGIH